MFKQVTRYLHTKFHLNPFSRFCVLVQQTYQHPNCDIYNINTRIIYRAPLVLASNRRAVESSATYVFVYIIKYSNTTGSSSVSNEWWSRISYSNELARSFVPVGNSHSRDVWQSVVRSLLCNLLSKQCSYC